VSMRPEPISAGQVVRFPSYASQAIDLLLSGTGISSSLSISELLLRGTERLRITPTPAHDVRPDPTGC